MSFVIVYWKSVELTDRVNVSVRHIIKKSVLAGKLCVPDAQVSNTVYVPTPPYVMGLSQASWQGSCASGRHRCPTLSTFPRHILTTHCLALYCNVISNVCWLSTS